MMHRRHVIAAACAGALYATGARADALSATAARAGASGFAEFVVGLKAEARRAGVSAATLERAFRGVTLNQKVLDRDRHQPEFTLTWERYQALVVNDQRIAAGREAYRQNRDLLARVEARFGVAAPVLLGIWGLESSFGTQTGGFQVVEALSTLAWEGRRASFFRTELIAALRILDAGDVTPAQMTGSYAGAMGQPQFMPSSYIRLAVDFDGDGRRDIWTDRADVLGSIANYLARSGWRAGQAWGVRAVVPPDFDPSLAGRDNRRGSVDWARLGIRPAGGEWPSRDGFFGLLLLAGVADDAFLVGPNFAAIRRYNPSDFYAVGVGLLGDMVTG